MINQNLQTDKHSLRGGNQPVKVTDISAADSFVGVTVE